MKNVKIPAELFEMMAGYVHDHYDSEDISRYNKIEAGVKRKYDAILRHEYYTISKTDESEDIREWARKEYLDAAGIHRDFRW